jgi:hypothetical protein
VELNLHVLLQAFESNWLSAELLYALIACYALFRLIDRSSRLSHTTEKAVIPQQARKPEYREIPYETHTYQRYTA